MGYFVKHAADVFDALTPDDSIEIAHREAAKAVELFLPSSLPKPQQQPQDSDSPPMDEELQSAIKAMAMADKVESMAARVARGLPPEEPTPDPFQEFGHELHPVHMDAISTAFQKLPEEHRADAITEAHGNVVKWIHGNQGKVVVDGKIHIADDLPQAEKLGQKIINEAIDNEDQKREDANNVTLQEQAAGAGNAQPAPASDTPEIRAAQRPTTIPDRATGSVASGGVSQPEIVPPGDEDKKIINAPTPQVKPEESANIGQVDKESQRPVLQPKESVTDNKKLALDAAPELNAKLQQLTSQVPGTQFSRLRPLKGKDRTETKVDEGKPPETLSDYLAAQISADSPQAKDQLLAILQKNFNVVDIDDQFLHGREDKAGYPSTNLQVQMSNGMTAEVQIVPKEVQDVSKQSHEFYKAGRDAEVKGNNQERDKQWGKAKEIHDAAMQAFKQRNDQTAQMQPQNQEDSIGTVRSPHQEVDGRHQEAQGISSNGASSLLGPYSQGSQGVSSQKNSIPEDLMRQSVESAGFKVASKPFVINGKMFIGVYTDNKPQAAPEPSQPVESSSASPEPIVSESQPSQSTHDPTQEPKDPAKESKYKYGSTQVNLGEETAKKIAALAAKIPKSELAGKGKDIGDGGHHVTVRYGLESHANLDDIKKAISKHPPFQAELGKTNVFPPTESSDGNAVVHVEIKSPEIKNIHKEIGDSVPTTRNSFTDENYKPHATVAYVKPEVAEKYKGLDDLEGHKFPVKSVHVSSTNGDQIEIPLEGTKELKKGDKVTLKDGRSGTLVYSHPEIGVARVKIGNKVVTINPRKFLI